MRWVPVDPNIMPSTIRKIQVLSLLFTLNICAGNVGLLYASVSLREVVRSLTPGITLAFSVWLLNKSYRMDAVWSLIAIAVGVIITTATELDLNMGGLIILLSGGILAALKGVTTNMVLVGVGSVHPLYVLYVMSPLALVQMIAMAFVFGETADLYATWESRSISLCAGMILSTGFMAFFLNIANFNLNKITSPVTVSVAGSFKEIVTIGLSFVVFQNKATPLNLFGILIALTGTGFYHYFAFFGHHRPTVEVTEKEKGTEGQRIDDVWEECELPPNKITEGKVDGDDSEARVAPGQWK